MIRSMTGFGGAADQIDGIHYLVEIRSLNNRYFKASIRLPEELAALESPLESALRKSVNRGSFTLTLKFRASDELAANRVNDTALLAYLNHLETINEKIKDQDVRIEMTNLLLLPGVLQPSEDEEKFIERATPAVMRLAGEAIKKLNQMRDTEGQSLAADLLKMRDQLKAIIGRIGERAPVVVEEYHAKLTDRVNQLTAKAQLKLGEEDLIREIAVFADRSDINEEISRVGGHLEHMTQIINGEADEPAGRTLDFLAQELLREANTIASKSNDAIISRAAVEMKSVIDRIKEQVQNAE